MQALRVGLFTEVYRPVRNGVVVSVETLLGELRGRGHQALCVTPTLTGCEQAEEGIVRLPSLPLPTRTAYRLTLPLLPRAARAALEGVSLVHAHSPFVTGWMGRHWARRLGVPLVFTYHTRLEHYVHYAPGSARTLERIVSALTRSYANAADVTIAPTAAMEQRLRSIGVRTRIEVVPSGIDVAAFSAGRRSEELRAGLGVPPAGIMLLWVGRLGREKNFALALETLARMEPAAHLVVVGGGPERSAFELSAARAAPGRVHFHGEVAREALPSIYASADALLFTSVSETQGLVLTEALACGSPVVAVDTPQSREVLGGAAQLCAGEAEALAAGLRAALYEGEAAAAARRVVAASYDGATVTERILSVYASLLS